MKINNKYCYRFALCLLALTLPMGHALARNVDLSTVPTRDTVQLTIYNSEDLTLVRETRKVSFKKGQNPLQFSWANTLIDASSVMLRFPRQGDSLELLDTMYPHDKPQMLYWNVHSERDGESMVEISYFTSGLTWSADYTALANQKEDRMQLEGFVRVHNGSGEDYENAQVRLVVGTINLVEKIAELARVPVSRVAKMEARERAQFKQKAARMMMDEAAVGAAMAPAPAVEEPKKIIKQGLSEYFIYTIEGRETIPNGWSKRLRSFAAQDVPVQVKYRYRPAEYGDQLMRLYVLRNDKPSKLGETPMPNGQVRILRDNGRDGMSLVANQSIPYVPIGDLIELKLGSDPRVVFELNKLRVWRDEIWMRMRKGQVYKKLGDKGFQVDHGETVAGWDEHVLYEQRISNYTGKAIDVEVRRSYSGDVVFGSQLDAKLHDYRTVEYHTQLKDGAKVKLYYEVMTRNGRNAKKNNVELVQKKVQ